MSRLLREVEGLEEQRTRAREDAKRAETARLQLEQEIKVRAPVPCSKLQLLWSHTHTHTGCMCPAALQKALLMCPHP